MSATRRINIMQDFESRFKRGKVTKKQYLTQKKAMLLEEQTEKQRAQNQAQASIDIITRQLEEIEEELATITETE